MRPSEAVTGTALLLARATTDEQRAIVGNQAGGRVFLFLTTDDFWGVFNRLKVAVGRRHCARDLR